MMADVESQKINTIIIWKIDRLSRSLKDFTNLWEEFQEKGIQLISLNDKFDTSTAIGRAMLHIVLVFAQLEREQTAERTINVMQFRAEKGMWNGGRITGYDLDPANKGSLIINPEQAKLVKKAFALCIEKGSAGQTQKALNELGYKMPLYESRRGKKHGDKLFTKQTVINLLTNQVYIGKIPWSGKVYKGNHKAIIDRKTFNKVQKILETNRRIRGNEKGPKKYVYILAGILRCGKCGSMMTPKGGKNGSGQPYHYYQCTKNSRIGKIACEAKYVPAKPLEDFVVERVKELSTHQEEIDSLINKANINNDKKVEKLKQESIRLETALSQVKAKINKLIDAIESGQNFKSLQERMQKMETERENLEKKISESDFETQKIEQEILSAETIRKNFKQLNDIIDKAKPQQLKDILANIIEIAEYHESQSDEAEGHIKISYFEQPNIRFPKNTKSEQLNKELFAQCVNWLPREDSNLGQIG